MMHGFPPFFLIFLVHSILFHTVLSAPYLAVHNLSSSHLNILLHASSPIILHPLNITRLVEDSCEIYHVPNTMTTLCFDLGFPCGESGIHNTIISAREYCERQLEREGDIPLPVSQEIFHEDLGYGAAINVVPSRPKYGITWGILKDAMDGLWEFLVEENRYVESDFDIYHGILGLVGRGTVRGTVETGLAHQSRSDSLGSTSA